MVIIMNIPQRVLNKKRSIKKIEGEREGRDIDRQTNRESKNAFKNKK